jgi:adenine/guanine phosphoribosyltransferase-like PRPP-binding protein
VDDVLTTGATLAAVERALEQHGHDVLGATVLAATPAPGAIRRDHPAAPAARRAEPQRLTENYQVVHR